VNGHATLGTDPGEGGFFPQSWSSRTFRVCRRHTALSSYRMTGDEHRSNATAIFSETWPTLPAQSPRSTGSIRAGASTPGPRPTQPLIDSDTASRPHVIVAVSSFFFRSTRDTLPQPTSPQPKRASCAMGPISPLAAATRLTRPAWRTHHGNVAGLGPRPPD
jgi:hypothetical protein